MRIGRTYHFESAHFLPNVHNSHKCKNMHGHNYRVLVTMWGNVDERGFVKDFAELDDIVLPLVRLLDHRVLNDIIPNPTAELIAEWFYGKIPDCDYIRVYETDDCWAEIGKTV